MIPIIDGICSKKKIKKFIFEKNFSKKIQNKKFISKFISKYEIEFLQNLISKENKIIKIIKYFFYFLLIFLKSFKISEKILLSKKLSWLNLQFVHSIWDTCIINNKEKIDKIEIRSRIKSSLLIIKKMFQANYLIKKKISHAILQHTVYTDRVLFAKLREKVKLFVQAKYNHSSKKKQRLWF